MSDSITFGGIDPALHDRVLSRRDAVGRTGFLATGLALASVPLLMAALPRRAAARQDLSQAAVDILNFALTLEYLEDDFYRSGLAANGLIPGSDRIVFEQISQHETAHVQFLRGVLGSQAVSRPSFDFTAGGAFGDVFSNYQTFLALAQGFEDTGVRAYKGQAGALVGGGDLLTAALQIHSVEARHAARVRRLRNQKGWIVGDMTDVAALMAVYAGEDNTVQAGVNLGSASAGTEAFDEPLDRDAVLAIAGMFIGPGTAVLGSGDVGVLNYAYALEQLEAAFYLQVAATPFAGITMEESAILNDLRDHEVAHRDYLGAALGSDAIGELTFDFSSVDFLDRTSVLNTARVLEDTGVAAYNGAGRLLTSPDLLTVAGKIVSVEARHAAAIRSLLMPRTTFFSGDDVVDPASGLDAALPPAEILQAAGPFIVTEIDASGLPTS